jgi:hypothetical protein
MAFPLARNEKMKRTILDSRRKVVSAIIAAYPGGRDCAAARLGLDLKKFDNHAYENAGHRPLTDEQIHLLEQQTGTTHLADYIASQYGGVFVLLPVPEDLDNMELYHRHVATATRRGRVDMIISKALEDGVIDEGEANAILDAHRHYISARHAEVTAVIVLHSHNAE